MKLNIIQKVTALLVAVLFSIGVFAQPFNLNEQAPIDPSIRYGKLENGMTYYIKKNSIPEKRANFYIYNRAGAILEEDHQDGLAHFLEHMGFNGIGHFPNSKDMMNYLESIGVKFGQNLNAGTSTDLTRYMVEDVPMIREGIIDSCLLIIHDWASDILCTNEELDEERGVITEEWRTGQDANRRTYKEIMKVMYKGSKYADRTVIGSMDVIKNFTRQDILDFYHKWYRPDMQGIAVIGDFDVDMMEAKIKKLMGSIPKHPNPTPIPSFPIVDNKEPLIGIYTDPELTGTSMTVFFKQEGTPFKDRNLAYLRTDYLRRMFNIMLQARMGELMQQPDLPITRASISYSGFQRTQAYKDALTCDISVKPGQTREAFDLVMAEAVRMNKFGFLQSELDRTKAILLSNVESKYAEREKRKTAELSAEIANHFYLNTPLSDPEATYKFAKFAIEDITLDEINKFAGTTITDENIIVILTAPDSEKQTLPSESDLLAMLKGIPSIKVEPYVDAATDKPLVAKEPKAGKIVKEKPGSKFGTTEWTLSNGMKVVIKPTDFKQDEILVQAYSKGGSSLLAEEDLPSARMFGVVNGMGLSDFGPVELRKKMSGKRVSLSTTLGRFASFITGSSTPKDLETFMQVAFLSFTQPRFDEVVLKNQLDMQRVELANADKNPMSAFNDTINLLLSGYSNRSLPLSVEMLDKVSLDRIKEIYSSNFTDPSGFTVVFLGNVDQKVLKPLVEKYLASIPSGKKQSTWKDEGIRPVKGIVRSDFKRQLEVEKVSVHVCYTGEIELNLKNRMCISMLNDFLRLRYTKVIREEMGATYGVGTGAQISGEPVGSYMLRMQYDTNPAQADETIKAIHAGLENLAENGPEEADWQKTVEFMQKNYNQNLIENKYWLSTVYNFYWSGNDFSTDYLQQLKELKPADVQKLAKYIIDQKSYFEVVMRPEN